MSSPSLQFVLDEARNASVEVRLPRYRDAVARYGHAAITPMTAWLRQPDLAAFAIRTLTRIAELDPVARDLVLSTLMAARLEVSPAHVGRDLDSALAQLGKPVTRGSVFGSMSSGSTGGNPRPHGHGGRRGLGPESRLRQTGYQISGMSRNDRWHALKAAVATDGLHGVAFHIVGLVRLRRMQADGPVRFAIAIREWEYDLARLKAEFYGKNGETYPWPGDLDDST